MHVDQTVYSKNAIVKTIDVQHEYLKANVREERGNGVTNIIILRRKESIRRLEVGSQ